MKRNLIGCLCLGMSLFAVYAQAQDYPAKSVRFIAPFPPGGTTDVLARVLAQKLGDSLGRQFVVENRPGASGNIGGELAAKAPSDGYTMVLLASSALVVNPYLYKRMPFEPLNDFAPISMVAAGGQVFVVHPSVPVKNVKELIALARANPGKFTYGSGGKGTPAHISAEVLKTATGIQMTHVPYKGTIQSVTDLVAGQIDMVLSDMVPAVPQVKSGRLRALAVSSEQRSQALPDIPTLAEAGVNIAIPQTWWAVLMPRGTPPAIINRLNGEVARILKQRDVLDRYASLGIFAVHSTPEKVLEQIKTESPQIGKVLRAAGVEPE